MGKTFTKFGYKVNIISSTLKADNLISGIHITGFDGNNLHFIEKKRRFFDYLLSFKPDIVICCEPFTILPASDYRKTTKRSIKIISDITEWYPENVAFKLKGLKKITTYIKLLLFNIYTVNLADKLILGEVTKLRRYNIIAPFKRKTIISYYPRIEYFKYTPPPFNGQVLTLCYAGVITFERGILKLLEAATSIANAYPSIKVKLKIVGKFQYQYEETAFMKLIKSWTNVDFEMVQWGNYEDISEKISDADICFDLRKRTFVYRNSLPIKIFEYMACGKPVIFSDIKPIQRELQLHLFGFAVNPENIEDIIDKVSQYLSNPILLKAHSSIARKLAEEKFNWESLENKLVNFIFN
ncbi:MAG: glycosyltransferase [Bacillota bacterium]